MGDELEVIVVGGGQAGLARRLRGRRGHREPGSGAVYLTNTANTRVFKVALPGAQIKLVGGDSGHVEHELFVDDVVLAPSERVVIDVLFNQPGELAMEHRTPERTYRLAAIRVGQEQAEPSLTEQFGVARTNPDMVGERERIAAYFNAEPDKTLGFLAEMDMGAPQGDGPAIYSCPMHPEIVREEPGHCPECGMKLVAEGGGHEHGQQHGHDPHEHGDHEHHDQAHGGHHHAAAGGIEWEDDMVEINRLTTPSNMRWKLIDKETGAENAAIDWRFGVGDQLKLRLLNEMAGDHPMHHPFHVHGAGRFMVLSRDGNIEPNLVWKDAVLVRAGETVRHPARRHQPRLADGSLPHRRAPRERNDVQLRRRSRREQLGHSDEDRLCVNPDFTALDHLAAGMRSRAVDEV